MEPLLDVVQHLGALAGVGGVDVEEDGLAALGANRGHDLLGHRHGRAAVEVDAEDVEAGLGEFLGRSAAEPARCSENQRPIGGSAHDHS